MLTYPKASRYASGAAAKSAAGIDSPEPQRRTSAAIQHGAFCCYGDGALGGFGLPGSFVSGLSTRPPSPPSIDSDAGDSDHKGVTTMAKLRLFPSVRSLQDRASAHRAMAKAALFSDSSAAVRLRRFNDHMEKARHLEARASGQEVLS